MLRRLGADAVGMSTVPEVLAARHADLNVVALSVITNSHVHAQPTTHEEVLETARRVEKHLIQLLNAAIPRLDRLAQSPAFV